MKCYLFLSALSSLFPIADAATTRAISRKAVEYLDNPNMAKDRAKTTFSSPREMENMSESVRMRSKNSDKNWKKNGARSATQFPLFLCDRSTRKEDFGSEMFGVSMSL
jgi:hypothetical protein